ncbi:glycosylphosphatidylinositol anchor attachment 1 protein [Tanacetum coccineum]
MECHQAICRNDDLLETNEGLRSNLAYGYAENIRYHSTQWALLKSVMVLAAFIGLCLMSVINFATAEIGALLLVPMCLMIKPLKVAGKLQSALNMVLVIVEFPGVSRFIWSKVHSGLANGSAYLEFWYSL